MTEQVLVSKTVGETAISLVLTGLGMWWAWQAYGLGLVQYGEIGPGAFPFGIGLLLALGGIGCALRSIFEWRASGGRRIAVSLDGAAFKLMCLTAGFAVLFVWVSPIVALMLFMSIMLVWVGRQTIAKAITLALVLSLSLYALFDRLLGVQLPADHLILLVGL